MVDPIRVLFDVTPLAQGVEPGIGRAGIFRATHGFLTEALARPELQSHVAALSSYFTEVQLSRYDRATGGALTARRVRGWSHSVVPHEQSVALVDAIVEAGETSNEARPLLATMALTSRMARPTSPLGPYDLYHSLRPAVLPAARVGARARVLTVHDTIPLRFPDLLPDGADRAFRAILDSVDVARDWIVCNAQCTRQDLCEILGIEPDRVVVVPLAADRSVFHPVNESEAVANVRRRYGVGDAPYVLSLCTIEPRKNLAHLIRCFSRLVTSTGDRDLHLVLVGATGWKTASVFAALEAKPGIRDRVVLTGQVPDGDLAPLYAGADVFVYPSRYEGFGLPVLEAMQCGVPVVTTTGGSLPEVIGSAGAVVDPDDTEALVDAMSRARGNRDFVAAGLARAAEFSWARTVDLTVAAYRVMLQ